VAKKVWRFFYPESDFNKDDAIEIAENNLSKVIDKMIEWREKHPRAFHRLPEYLKFYVMENFNPRFEKSRCVMEFNIYLDSGEVEVIKR
jgi:uncharacterized protein YydD (DUF2326 family)